jgi:hypothetical protein
MPDAKSERAWPRRALCAVAAVWVAVRVAAPGTTPPPAAARALDGIQAGPSIEGGRLEVRGWPDAAEEIGIADLAEVRGAAARLDARVSAANAALARLAADAAARIELFPEGSAGLRLAGLLVPFEGTDAEELAALADPDAERPWETLRRLGRVLADRLEEPPDVAEIEPSLQRRELTRLHREIRDALEEKEAEAVDAAAAFRAEALAAVRAAGGPILRRGRWVAIEAVLAALLGAMLRETVRRRPTPGGTAVTAALASVLAVAAVAGLAGTRWLPEHPALGVSPGFAALAFVLGWATPGLLAALSRLDRDTSDAETPPAAPPRGAAAPPPAPPAAPRPTPSAGERAPFFPRRR